MDRGGGKTKPTVYQLWDCGKSRGAPGLGELPNSVREDSTDGASAIRALLRDFFLRYQSYSYTNVEGHTMYLCQ